MANVKISSLPSASSVSGADTFPMVQGGTTKQASLNVIMDSPTMGAPALGTPASGVLTNCTGLPTTGLVDGAVTDAKLRDSAALSVIGRSANTTGDPADISAASDHQVLRRSGTSVGFGAVALNQTNAVTGTLPVANGGTGVATLTGLVKGNGTSAFSAAVAGTDYPGLATSNTFSADQVISVNSTGEALRITQIGTGLALKVEDSANPDSTPFSITAEGQVGIGSIPSDAVQLSVGGSGTTNAQSNAVLVRTIARPDNSTTFSLVRTWSYTADNGGTPYTLPNLNHFAVQKVTWSADSTVGNHRGFSVESTFDGGTNDYAFHARNPAGTNNWAFYADQAASYFGGDVTFAANVSPGVVISGSTSSDALRITQLGAGNALVVEDSANPDATPFVVAADGKLGLGTSTPASKIEIQDSTTANLRIQIDSTSSSSAGIPTVYLQRSSTASQGTQSVGQISWAQTFTDASSAVSAYILATGSNIAGSNFCNLIFNANKSHIFQASGDEVSIGSSDALIVGSTTTGAARNTKLGYVLTSGGAVTQSTSRTTAVTLNKTNGAITLVSDAGTTSWQSFTVNNSLVAEKDVVYVCQKSGADLYEIHVTNVQAGSFQISFKTTGGTTTEQPVFNFVVLAAQTS